MYIYTETCFIFSGGFIRRGFLVITTLLLTCRAATLKLLFGYPPIAGTYTLRSSIGKEGNNAIHAAGKATLTEEEVAVKRIAKEGPKDRAKDDAYRKEWVLRIRREISTAR
jgi:hypothetical protein